MMILSYPVSIVFCIFARPMKEDKTTGWHSPSNIALIKYWGKKGQQIPANPSLSMTLKKSYTETRVTYKPDNLSGSRTPVCYLNGKRNADLEKRISGYLKTLEPILPFLRKLQLTIHTKNTFPHSAGIASSASGFSALALCLCSIENDLLETLQENDKFLRKASLLARLGSGSGSRSVYGDWVIWGKDKSAESSSDEYAVPVPFQVHETFRRMRDAILIVSAEKKPVSSSSGHALMDNHPFAKARYSSAHNNLNEMARAIQQGDLEAFITITEKEALTLHGLMMSSSKSYLLLHPNSIILINKIREFRERSKIPVCFTLDAGPNIHLLYPHAVKSNVKTFIETELLSFCENRYWIDDSIGNGPEKLF